MAGALDFLDTLVNRAADVAVAKAGFNPAAPAGGNGDVQTARMTDQSFVPYTSPAQISTVAPLGLPVLVVIGIIGAAFYLMREG